MPKQESAKQKKHAGEKIATQKKTHGSKKNLRPKKKTRDPQKKNPLSKKKTGPVFIKILPSRSWKWLGVGHSSTTYSFFVFFASVL